MHTESLHLQLQGETFGSAAQFGRLLNSCWAINHSALQVSVLMESHSPAEGRYSVWFPPHSGKRYKHMKGKMAAWHFGDILF